MEHFLILRRLLPVLGVLIFSVTWTLRVEAYSVFTHEQLIDLAWNRSIQPLLLAKYPHTSEARLRQAHAFAYGGCVIQDLGYYPFGKAFFSDLTHYVRSGDFIQALLRQARDVDEYAFALGALSHYIGDNIGHEDAINPATAIQFPKLRKKFGDSITYDESPHGHIRTEFAFDVQELTKHRLAPAAYLRYIGLRVSRPLLERAFFETYALNLNQVLGPARRPSFRAYRWSVRSFLPRVAYAEALLHRGDFGPDPANAEFERYARYVEDADFQKVWNRYRRKPGFRTYTIAFLLKILPKVGPLANAAICVPTEATDELYVKSVNGTLATLREAVSRLGRNDSVAALLPNRDLDTGEETEPGGYRLTDKTYVRLLRRIAELQQPAVPPRLREDLLAFFADPAAPKSSQIESDLAQLRNTPETRKGGD
jgi:hypothetical protein